MTLQHWHFSTKPLLLKGICPFRLQWGPQKVASTLSGYYSHCLSHYRSNPEPVQPSLEKSPSAWLTSSLNGAQLTVQHSVKRTWKRLWRKVLHRKDLQTGAMLTKKSFCWCWENVSLLQRTLFYFCLLCLPAFSSSPPKCDWEWKLHVSIFGHWTWIQRSRIQYITSSEKEKISKRVFLDNFFVSLVTICSNQDPLYTYIALRVLGLRTYRAFNDIRRSLQSLKSSYLYFCDSCNFVILFNNGRNLTGAVKIVVLPLSH